jgi:SET domain
MAERPLFILPPNATPFESNHQIEQLPVKSKADFLALCNSFPELGHYGIVRTNAFGLGSVADNEQRRPGLFLNLSRLNHSCIPNCERWWDEAKEVETLYSLRDIEKGEELTIYYGEIISRRDTRQNLLRQVWRFECQCECCGLPGEEQVKSDVRRETISRTLSAIGSINTKAALRRAKSQVQRAVALTKEEGIRGGLLATVCYDGYQIFLLARQLRESKNYIEMAYQEYLLGTGPDSPETRKMKDYLERPKSHANWSLGTIFV